MSLDHNDHKILHILSDAVRKMSEGELLQIEKARSLNLSEDVYFEIIRNKTASLLASACSAGAWSTSNNEEIAEKMRLFGESENIGKPTGNDIKENR